MFKKKHDCETDGHKWGPWIEGSTSGIKTLAALVGVNSSGEGKFRKCNVCGDVEVE